MQQIETLLNSNPEDLLAALPTFQQGLIKQLYQQEQDYQSVADKWLSAKTANTVGFGGSGKGPVLYREAILDEIEKYICGDAKYKDDRQKLGTGIKVALGAISSSIGAAMGVAGPYILPVVVLLIISLGKVPMNAWCEKRKSERQASKAKL